VSITLTRGIVSGFVSELDDMKWIKTDAKMIAKEVSHWPKVLP